MEVILLERVENLGIMGDVVRVKPGYARNFLFPNEKAVPASNENKASFENKRLEIEAKNIETKAEAEKVASKIKGEILILVRQAGDSGQLYGSVNSRDIKNTLKDMGYELDRNQISLNKPIKSVGIHNVSIALHPEIYVEVIANVARSEEEAKIQTETGEAVIAEPEKDEES
ncbi:MAG: 50S ribosomal protein L9 [Alphaproteobacteria bacterium]|jgi:large subunit ribosomal protein L9|nr:50S ribosomal protein L9 [Alphaproteobacteria bacterium]MBL12294.1 50S ribosomal protein L9 [Rhodospirillaceae bacterium]PPR60651.1 MAG: 50S ribosomal protein L9 [Alphaproteobacteria bacterium MarineAlpha3_Bin7]|tara:strand:- start:457 stop:972 length:516 start_codon:yes stop_codon:yes gene_type:complete